MTLAVLDPYLFRFDEDKGLHPLSGSALEAIVLMLDRQGLLIPEDRHYWPRLVGQMERLSTRMAGDRRYREHLRRLERRTSPVPFSMVPGGVPIQVQGFDLMFSKLEDDWLQVMRGIVTSCVLTDRTILVTRLLKDRNARAIDHEGLSGVFIEKLCWELRVQVGSGALHRVPCIASPRNLDIPWTRRYADGLPAHEDGSRFPFCPPDDWMEPGCAAWQAHKARPAWRDRFEGFWAEPSAQQATAKSEHWDVYLNKAMEQEYGLGQLNIVRWRSEVAPVGAPRVGELHHVPGKKAGRLKKATGWVC